MLVLSRKTDERIVIDEIVIVVLDVRGDKVRLGIEAPKEIPVHRGEVHDQIKRLASNGLVDQAGGKVPGRSARRLSLVGGRS